MPLPTQAEMFENAIQALTEARKQLAAASDWLNADWTPAGSSLPDEAGNARAYVRPKIGQLKNEIDVMKIHLYEGLDEIRMHNR
jgi:hypothetical protein